MQSGRSERARANALQSLRNGRCALAGMEAARERAQQAHAERESDRLREEQRLIQASLPEVHGIACDLAGFHQRLRLLGVARASLLDLGIRAASAEGRCADHERLARQASQRREQHRRAAERMALVGQKLGARMRRRAEQSIENELEEISSWSMP